MNRVTYKLHPSEYDLGENEKFYSDMEAKGWRIIKRGLHFSKFIPVEPSRTKYRIEVSSPAFLGEEGLSEGQLAVFEDCGWEHAASRGFLHIFRAPEGSDTPEFYTDPRQQAQTLKKVRRSLWTGWIVTLAALAFAAWFIMLAGKPWGNVFAEMFKRFIQVPPFYLVCGCALFRGICQMVWDTWKINRTYLHLKKGVPLDHTPKRRLGRRLVDGVLLGFVILSLLLLTVQLITTHSEDMPAKPDGPYIMLTDIGWEGERTEFMDRSSGVTHTTSLLANYWETVEYIRTQEDTTVWLRQNIYRLRFPGMAGTLTQSLMETDTLAHGPESFSPVEVEGFDAVWATRYEMVAVRGDMVAYTVFLNWADDGIDCQAICAALQAAWES